MLHASQTNARAIDLGKAVQSAAVLLAVAGFVMLAMVASGQAYTELDVRIASWVQGLDFPGLTAVVGMVNFATAGPMAIALWLAAMTFFVVKGRPIEAIAMFLIGGLWAANQSIGFVIDRPVPSQESGALDQFSRTHSGSFPSGHVTGAVTFFGLLAFLTLSNVRPGRLRMAMPAIAIAMIALTSFSRVYAGAHWLTDVLGSYLLGSVGVAGIVWFYINVKFDTLHIPHPAARNKPSR